MPLQVVGLLIEGDRTMGDLWPLQVGFNQGHLWASGYEKGKFSTLCYIYLMEFASTTWVSPFTMTLFSPGDRWAWTTLLTSALSPYTTTE